MSIATSLEKLSETLDNCKTNLKEKEVSDVDNIKISDVDEKIAEIQAGGGNGFKFIENVSYMGIPITGSTIYNQFLVGDTALNGDLKFTPTADNVSLFFISQSAITNTQDLNGYRWNNLTKGTEYTINFRQLHDSTFFAFIGEGVTYQSGVKDNADLIGFVAFS